MVVFGNTAGIKKDILFNLGNLIGSYYPRHLLLSEELGETLAYYSSIINREIAVYLDRRGRLCNIMLGTRQTVPLLNEHLRRNNNSLCGLRCIHTHLSGGSELSSLDISAMQENKLDAMVALGLRNGKVLNIQIAMPGTGNNCQMYGPLKITDIYEFPFLQLISEIEDIKNKSESQPTVDESNPRALLIGFKEQKGDLLSGEESLKELEDLAYTANLDVQSRVLVSISNPDPALYLGKGKVGEISLYRQQESLDLVVVDQELSLRQQRNLEDSIGCAVIDRTALILQIFADRARTKEGKLQVELAQLNYLLPRLIGYGKSLSRLAGGIGTRGPGETKLETDRRRIRQRINELQKEIKQLKKQRSVLRKQRLDNKIPVVALVGYTNAGKSTLMNLLTQAGVLTENKLFATLDPTTRRLKTKRTDLLLTDTVGFIHKLPRQLVAAFRATLEEINYADLILHIVDASNPAFEAHIQSVNQILGEIGADKIQSIIVFNKWDLVEDPVIMGDTLKRYSPSLPVSALKNYNINELLELISANLTGKHRLVTLCIPFSQTSLINTLYENGEVIATDYREEGIFCEVYLNKPFLEKVQHLIQ